MSIMIASVLYDLGEHVTETELTSRDLPYFHLVLDPQGFGYAIMHAVSYFRET